MANTGRKIGSNIFTLMQNAEISREDLAAKLNYSYRDMCRILEGKMMLSSAEVGSIANFFGKTKQELLHYKELKFQYMIEFNDMNNLDKILDLLDEYVDLKEAM